MKKVTARVNKACLAVIALSAAASSFAGVIDCAKTPCGDPDLIFVSASALSAGGYELEVGRALVIDGYQANISLFGGSEQERSRIDSSPFDD